MRIDDLIRYGLPRRFADCLKHSGPAYLLPLQAEAVQAFGLLEGKSLLVSGPTSSGKTFCGELACIGAVSQGAKAIILVPLKALASERFSELKKRYREADLEVIIVTSDYPENKELFLKGRYDIAVMVYEMFNSLLVSSLSPIDSAGAVVLDELQLAASRDRGPAYEVAISKVRFHSPAIQVVGLIGGLDECDAFARWLGLPLLRSTHRPVELHRGVLYDGRFSFRRYNDCVEGTEYFTCACGFDDSLAKEAGVSPELLRAIKHLTDKQEQVLVFVSSRSSCQGLAVRLAGLLDLAAAKKVMEELGELPETLQKKDLELCLAKGIGFHDADLGPSCRKILEGGFRSGEIRVMIATTTLALGVNLPSRNVFLEPVKYCDGYNGDTVLRPLLAYDYNQIAGRAGRLGAGSGYGRAIMIAADDNRRQLMWDAYVYGCARTEVQPLEMEELAGVVLRWVCCGMVRDFSDAKVLLAATFRGFSAKEGMPSGILEILGDFGFVEFKGCRLSPTPLGRAAAMHNISLSSAVRIKAGLIEHGLGGQKLSWFYYLADIQEGRKMFPGRNFAGDNSADLGQALTDTLARFDETAVGPLTEYLPGDRHDADRRRLWTTLLLGGLLLPIQTIDLESQFCIGWGRIKRVGEEFANLLRAVVDIADSLAGTQAYKGSLSEVAECLHYGLPASGLGLGRLRVRLLERDYILRLVNNGIGSVEEVVAAGVDVLSAIIPEGVARRLFETCQKTLRREGKSDAPENFRRHAVSARRFGRRYLIHLNNQVVSLQPRLFAYFQRLSNCDRPGGWLDKNMLDRGTNQVRYIYKLRQALQNVPGISVQGDGAGRYRLVIEALDALTVGGPSKTEEKQATACQQSEN